MMVLGDPCERVMLRTTALVVFLHCSCQIFYLFTSEVWNHPLVQAFNTCTFGDS